MMLSYKEIVSYLWALQNSVSSLGKWDPEQNKEFIEVGEYGLALDGIAFAHLANKLPISPDQYKIVKMLSDHMELEKDSELSAVAELLARSDGSAV